MPRGLRTQAIFNNPQRYQQAWSVSDAIAPLGPVIYGSGKLLTSSRQGMIRTRVRLHRNQTIKHVSESWTPNWPLAMYTVFAPDSNVVHIDKQDLNRSRMYRMDFADLIQSTFESPAAASQLAEPFADWL